jgi:hypothetical protein
MHLAGKTDDFAPAEMILKNRLVREIASAALHFDTILKAIEAVDSGGAGRWSQNSHEHPNRRGLAGAVRAEESKNLSIGNRQREVFDCFDWPIGFGEALNFDEVRGLRRRYMGGVERSTDKQIKIPET